MYSCTNKTYACTLNTLIFVAIIIFVTVNMVSIHREHIAGWGDLHKLRRSGLHRVQPLKFNSDGGDYKSFLFKENQLKHHLYLHTKMR